MPYCDKYFVRYAPNLANTYHTDRFRPDVQVSSSVKYTIESPAVDYRETHILLNLNISEALNGRRTLIVACSDFSESEDVWFVWRSCIGKTRAAFPPSSISISKYCPKQYGAQRDLIANDRYNHCCYIVSEFAASSANLQSILPGSLNGP